MRLKKWEPNRLGQEFAEIDRGSGIEIRAELSAHTRVCPVERRFRDPEDVRYLLVVGVAWPLEEPREVGDSQRLPLAVGQSVVERGANRCTGRFRPIALPLGRELVRS